MHSFRYTVSASLKVSYYRLPSCCELLERRDPVLAITFLWCLAHHVVGTLHMLGEQMHHCILIIMGSLHVKMNSAQHHREGGDFCVLFIVLEVGVFGFRHDF